MTERPIKLNRARKARARNEARRRADENALRFGRGKAERARDAAEAERGASRLDGHRLDENRREGGAPDDGENGPEGDA